MTVIIAVYAAGIVGDPKDRIRFLSQQQAIINQAPWVPPHVYSQNNAVDLKLFIQESGSLSRFRYDSSILVLSSPPI